MICEEECGFKVLRVVFVRVVFGICMGLGMTVV